LHAEADAVDACLPVARETGQVDGFGICFERDFAVLGDVERGLAGGNDAPDFVRLEQRRRPAAEVDGVGCFPSFP